MEIMTTTPHSATNQKELRLFAAPITSTSTVSSTAEHMGKNGARSPFQREVREWQRIDPDTGALMTGRLEADRWISGPLNSYGKKSSSSISNSSNNSTTAMQTETTTTTTSTNFSSNLNKNSSMNTHKSMAGKNISLHAIVGNSNNLNTIGDRTTKTTASLTPSSSPSSPTTTTTTRPSWQQPTIFRQNGNSSSNNNNSPTSGNNPLTQARGSSNSSSLRNTTPQQHPSINNTSSSSTNPSSSHLTKSRVGDNNCCGGGSSSDESRSYSTAELRHHHSQHQPHHQHHHHLRQREQQTTQHEQRQSPALFQLKPQNDRLTPTQSAQLKPQQQHQQQQQQQYQSQHYNRVDLESFRHYNNNTSNSHHITSDTYAADDPTLSTDHHHPHQRPRHNDDDGDALRLSSRHMRRQQIPQETDNSAPTTSLHRSRSISTDDLSTEWDVNGVDNEEPAEWRRVSKLRRSFQNSCSTKTETATPTPARRPLDLPESSVSVSKIRAELENGRRLNTVMKNNHVDLAALSSILNGPDTKPVSPSPVRSSFLTAESLKEIRGKLKRLSDESLYKEDFLINQQNNSELPEQEHIEVQPSMIRKSVEKSPERYNDRENTINLPSKHTTNSLESRLKYKETNPTEWHLRRKSYGFEKMSPPDKSMQRMDASTDSGLGRSGELQNWSPTNQEHQRNSTVVVRLGENSSQRSSIMGVTSSSTAVQRRYRPQQSFEESENSPEEDAAPNKRHSIAVDESQYVRDNGRQTTQVRLNGFYERNSPLGEGKFVQTSEVTSTSSAGGFSQKVHQQKRVEFCKTEVHFATESGRVNIVETDSKPPPTNNFRRRRNRSSSVGPLQSLVKSATTVSTTSSPATSTVAMPVTLFGDDKLRRKTIASTTVAYRAPLVDSPEPIKETSPTTKNVTVTTVAESYVNSESSRSSYASTSGVDTTDYETDEMTSLRGILKNKPAKPKPYVLGENIETPDELWGVQVKSSRALNDSPQSNVAPIKSVAERIQDLSQTNGFSTKINLNVGSTSPPVIGASSTKTWEESDLPTSNVMSIKLHSPQATTEVPTAVKVVPPVAKPRTVNSSVVSETKSTTKPYQSSLPTKDSLKIIKEARGARQLREHELSYFGIEASKLEQEKLRGKYPQLSSASRNSPKRSLPLRRLSEEMSGRQGENERSTPSKWQLEHDKPDLLKHNPPPPQHREDPSNIKPTERTSLKKKAELDEEEEHLYENIANEITPVFKVKEVYDRKLDLQRDAMILSEMNESADQTLRELSDEASLKDRKRRSLQRRNSKPLETIDEKAITEKISDTCIAVKVARGTLASEAKKSTRHSTPSPNRMNATTTTTTTRERTSSQSSVECCPRARSRSLSSEKEYDNVKAATKSTRSTQMMKHKSHRPQTERRSSSLDSQRSYHSQYSSGEEQHQHQQLRNSLRREDRSRAKTKRTSNSSSSSAALNRQDAKPSKSTSSSSTTTTHGEFKRSSSTTRSSTHKERVECNKDNVNGLATTSLSTPKREALQREPHHTSSLQRGSAISSSGRRHRDELRDSQRLKRATASGKSSEKQESNGKHASASRLSRDDERNNSMRSSSHRLERGTASAADKEKEKLSRSKAHSSRSTSQQRHEQRTTTTTTTTSSSHNNDSERIAGKSSKTKAVATTASTENTTYVSVTNLANEQTKQEILVNNEASKEIAAVVTTQTSSSFQHHRHHTVERGEEIREEKKQNKDDNDDEQTTAKTDEKIPPPKPPRKKRKQSLIPIAIPSKPERQPPSPPQSHSPSNDHSPTYEYKLKSKIIPPSYSNQSTLRKSSLPRPTSRLALLNKARKPSQKSTHSTSSSFAFLPYLPAKRNSDVSHVYDNYMLYAVPAAINTKAYQQNLVNDHAQLFGSAGGNRYHHQYHLGYGGKGLRRRTVRSTVSTHQPFGICTCS
ncbi:uncharacterized protein isoform X8 [Musca autumnalis]|uniref:uncharacterized protein isoform X8 n=1 Tax=Musca autumnalis TaxID=221902 RepID=UPI003CF82814